MNLTEDITLWEPWFLGLVPVVWLLWFVRRRRARAALPAASTALLVGLPTTLRQRLVWLPSVLHALAATGLVVALARPVTRDVLPLEAEGVDILLVIDTSSSMLADDMERQSSVRRIDAAREQALAFAAAREHDRVGLLTFALFPDLRCPLTLDKRAVAAFLRSVDTVTRGSDEDRTAIGVALGSAVEFMRADAAATKVIVLLTDGSNNVDEVSPEQAAKLAKDAGIRVHTIGLGLGLRGPFGQLVEMDFADIETIAETTGGTFFRARSAADLEQVYAAIDREEKVALDDPRFRTTDWFLFPAAIGAALFLLGLALELSWLRGVPA